MAERKSRIYTQGPRRVGEGGRKGRERDEDLGTARLHAFPGAQLVLVVLDGRFIEI
jgi:hypothetical protein